MSVINKMLRDLDARRAGGALPGLQRHRGPDALFGTASVGAPGVAVPARYWRAWSAAGLLLASVALAVWYGLGGDAGLPLNAAPPAVAPATPVASAPVPVTSQAPGVAASAPAVAASAPVGAGSAAQAAAAPANVASATDAGAPRTDKNNAGERAAQAAHETRTAVVAAAPEKPRAQTGTATAAPARATPRPVVPDRRPAPMPAAAVSAPVRGAAPAGAGERRQAAARAALAQARGLWVNGSRDAALNVVRDAVLLAERSQPVDPALLAILVREQARMELALGRPAAVLELLSRLEPALATQADLWAVRGNAAQRLGRHGESVQAYLTALQLRPGESRWMLGAAVSLAAQGQLEAAAQQAEQARALGPVSPEVLNYLRQAGVPLR